MGAHIYILHLSQSAAGNQAYTHHGPLVMYFSGYYFKKIYFCPQVNCFLHLLWSKQHHPQNPHDVVMPPVSDLCLSDFALGGQSGYTIFLVSILVDWKFVLAALVFGLQKAFFFSFVFSTKEWYSLTVLLIAEWQRQQQELHIAIHRSNVKSKRFNKNYSTCSQKSCSQSLAAIIIFQCCKHS